MIGRQEGNGWWWRRRPWHDYEGAESRLIWWFNFSTWLWSTRAAFLTLKVESTSKVGNDTLWQQEWAGPHRTRGAPRDTIGWRKILLRKNQELAATVSRSALCGRCQMSDVFMFDVRSFNGPALGVKWQVYGGIEGCRTTLRGTDLGSDHHHGSWIGHWMSTQDQETTAASVFIKGSFRWDLDR